MAENGKSTYTAELTNKTLTITEDDGLTRVSIYNGTATAGTVTGTKAVNRQGSTAINIAQNETVTISVDEAYVLDGITIVAPTGCTLKVIAN